MNGARESGCRRWLGPLIAAAFVFVFSLPRELRAEPLSVEQFVAVNAEWEKHRGTYHIEGRIGSVGKQTLRMQKCDLTFNINDEQLKTLGNARYAQLIGKIRKEAGKLHFDVSSLQVSPSDSETYRQRAARLKNTRSAAEWYALGEWATRRGAFYDDAELTQSGEAAAQEGVQEEVRELAQDDVAGRLRLAEKLAAWPSAAALRLELAHAAYRRQWSHLAARLNESTDAEREALFQNVAKQLPGADQPLAKADENLRKQYLAQPEEVYRSRADESSRKALHRFFWIEMRLKSILLDAASDGRNGDEIADALTRFVPEERELANRYRQLRVKYRLERVTTMTRADVTKFADDLRANRQADQAEDVQRRWLKARERLSREEGATGLIQLADDYATWLDDKSAATKYLVEAYQLEPTLPQSADRLRGFGLELRDGKWGKPTGMEAPSTPAPTMPSRVEPGFSLAQVKELLGDPTSRTRIISAAGITEIWCYGAAGSSRLVIRMERSAIDKTTKVTRVENER